MLGGTPAQDPLSQVVPGNDDMGGDRDAIVAQIAQLIEHPDPTQKPLWDGSGLPETAAEMLELDMEDLKRKVTLMLSQALGPADAAPDHPVDHPDPDNGAPAELVTTLADIVTAPDDQAELQANLRRLEALRTEPVGGLRGLWMWTVRTLAAGGRTGIESDVTAMFGMWSTKAEPLRAATMQRARQLAAKERTRLDNPAILLATNPDKVTGTLVDLLTRAKLERAGRSANGPMQKLTRLRANGPDFDLGGLLREVEQTAMDAAEASADGAVS